MRNKEPMNSSKGCAQDVTEDSGGSVQEQEEEQEQEQEADGLKLKELENALDGLYDEIMTPSDKLLGGDMTLPKRAWKPSKPVRDDVWRNDADTHTHWPLRPSSH